MKPSVTRQRIQSRDILAGCASVITAEFMWSVFDADRGEPVALIDVRRGTECRRWRVGTGEKIAVGQLAGREVSLRLVGRGDAAGSSVRLLDESGVEHQLGSGGVIGTQDGYQWDVLGLAEPEQIKRWAYPLSLGRIENEVQTFGQIL